MNTVIVNDIELEYETRGTGDPVVFIHGAFISDAFWPILGERVLIDRYRVIAYRRRGYGRSPKPKQPVTLARQAADCRDLLNHLGVERAHVVGHSYGGAIALEIATETPDIVNTLGLLEPALILGSSGDEYRESLLHGMEKYQAEGAAPIVEDMLRARWGEDPQKSLESVLPGAFRQAVEDAVTSFEAELPALLDWNMGKEQLQNICKPVLVVLGDRSRDLSPRFVETYKLLLSWLPEAEGYVLPGAAHGLQMQNPAAMAARFEKFFSRHSIKT